MTSIASSPAGRRPAKPRRSPIGLIAFLAFGVVTWWAASSELGIDFDVLELLTNLTRGAKILAEFWPPNWSYLPDTIEPMIETVKMAVIASLVGCGVGLPIAFLGSRVTSPNRLAFVIDRSVLSVVRALPDVLYALIFIVAIGIGPLPGILALVLFNIGVLAKLLSETIDGVDRGPIEAVSAAGGDTLQANRWAVLPQVLPNYVAYSLYVFELNIRASAVIGLVGAGGIGSALNTQRRFFAYDNVMVILIEIFVFVFVIELISIWLRRRLV